jgi:hypothetical protein
MRRKKEQRQASNRAEASPQNTGETGESRRLANLERGTPYRWQKGVSGNPGGRPKTSSLAQACRVRLSALVPKDRHARTFAEAIADALAAKALNGDIRATQELADRAEGRPRQSLEVDRSKFDEAFQNMTDDEMLAYATSGALPTWFPKPEGDKN